MCAPHPIPDRARESIYLTPPAATPRPQTDDIDALLDREERGDLIFGLVLLAAFATMVAAFLLA